MTKIYKIHERLYISSYRAAQKIKQLEKEGITAIVALMEKKIKNPPPKYNFLFKLIKDKTYIPFGDLAEIMIFIEENVNNGKVLVHCNSGISRSGGIVVARLLYENPDWTWEQARNFVRNIVIIEPHPNIRKSILDYFESIEKRRRSDIY
jgi:protein tyrosine phosphatase